MVDDRVAVIDDGVEVERYREIEVEALVDGAPLEGIVNVLIDVAPPGPPSAKLPQRWGQTPMVRQTSSEPATVGPDDSAREAITAFCASASAHSSLRTSGAPGSPQTPCTKCASPRDACAAVLRPRPLLDEEWPTPAFRTGVGGR